MTSNIEKELSDTVTPFKLLNLAKECEKAGISGFASDLYVDIINRYPESPESEEANKAILSIAGRLASEGKISSSLLILEKLKLVCRLSLAQIR